MLSPARAKDLATRWLAAWNSRDLERVMAFYADSVVLISPVAVELLKVPSGEVRGKAAVRAYFKKGLESIPYLHFELISTLAGVSSIVVYYINHKGTKTGEYLEFDSSGRIVRDVANYLVT